MNILDLPDDILLLILLHSFPSLRFRANPYDDPTFIAGWIKWFNWSEHKRNLAETCTAFTRVLLLFDYEFCVEIDGTLIMYSSSNGKFQEMVEWSDIMNSKEIE